MPRKLSPERIVEHALALADAEGLEALSMRRLAATLGVTAMSIYNHVASKDDLLDRMLDRVVGEFDSPEIGGDWVAMLRRRATSAHAALLRHSWAAQPLLSRISLGPAILHDIDRTIGCLVTAGFSYGQADWARNALDNHIYGYTLQEPNYPVSPAQYQQAAAQFLPMIPQAEYPYMHEAAQQIIRGDYDGKTRFDFGLDLILEGLQRWLAPNKQTCAP